MTKFMEYLGTPSNLVGSTATVAVVAGTALLDVNPLITVGAAIASYVGGFLIASPTKHLITVNLADSNEEKLIEQSIKVLEQQIRDHQNALPDSIQQSVNGILGTLKDLLPRWKEMDSYGDQKFTVNSIITDYLPNTLNTYLALPKSYLVRTKKDAEGNILKQLSLLQKTVDEIQDNVYKGVEQKIEEQGRFLESKFNAGSALELK